MSVTIEKPAAVGDVVSEKSDQNDHSFKAKTSTVRRRDPSREEILQECLRIQATWSDHERLQRLRVDWRPSFRRCDGEFIDMDSADYNMHISIGEELREKFCDD